ncbi:hypothetical protein ANO11243_032180 [Dothideomycetidae sp. 11243]|nr:hypothetical protein ANO11243_032180 [fungal sp. No.11243]
MHLLHHDNIGTAQYGCGCKCDGGSSCTKTYWSARGCECDGCGAQNTTFGVCHAGAGGALPVRAARQTNAWKLPFFTVKCHHGARNLGFLLSSRGPRSILGRVSGLMA